MSPGGSGRRAMETQGMETQEERGAMAHEARLALLVGGDPLPAAILEAVTDLCAEDRLVVEQAAGLTAALTALAAGTVELILLDLRRSADPPLLAVECLVAMAPDAVVVALVPGGDERLALEAVRRGAQDCLIGGDEPAALARRTLRLARERKRFESLGAARDHRLLDFADIAGDWLWETDADLRLTFVSDRIGLIFGFGLDPERLLGRSCLQLARLIDNPDKAGEFRRRLADRRPFRGFVCRVRDTGVVRYLRLNGRPMFTPRGAFLGYRGQGADATEQVEAETFAQEALAILVDATEALPDGVAVFDEADRFLIGNDRLADFLPGCSDLLTVGTRFDAILRGAAERGLFTEAVGRIDAWLAQWLERCAAVGLTGEPMADGSHLFVHQRPTRRMGFLRIFRPGRRTDR